MTYSADSNLDDDQFVEEVEKYILENEEVY